MKNLFYLSVLVLSAGLTACASDDVETRSYRYAAAPEMAPAHAVAPAPAVAIAEDECEPAPVQQVRYQPAPAPIAQDCGGCPAKEYTVRTPVKVVFKNTTYRTVYEPRTFETTSYETRPYNRAEVCNDGNCGEPTLVSRRPM